jgi:hypothetical protein
VIEEGPIARHEHDPAGPSGTSRAKPRGVGGVPTSTGAIWLGRSAARGLQRSGTRASTQPAVWAVALAWSSPKATAALAVGDIVLCKVSGSEYLHLVKGIQGERFQIGNNRGHINGWVGPNAIYWRLVSVAP